MTRAMQPQTPRPLPQSNYVLMDPYDQPRGPPRSYHEFHRPKPSQARLIETVMSRPPPEIRLYFISADDIEGSIQDGTPNPNEMGFVLPALNKFTQNHDQPYNHVTQQHIVLPPPQHLAAEKAVKLQLKIGAGGMPFQYETHGPYIWVRRFDDHMAWFDPPAGYPLCVRIKFDIQQRFSYGVEAPPQVPGTGSGETPRDDQVMDAVRIDISMTGVSNKLSLHFRFVDSMDIGFPSNLDPVQPRLFNIGYVRLDDPLEQDTISKEGVIVGSTYTVKLNPLRRATQRQCLMGGPRTWSRLPLDELHP